MKGIILASHGRLAEGLLDTLTIFSGEPQQIRALCLLPGEEITDFMKMLEDAIQEVDTGVICCLALRATAVQDFCRIRYMLKKSA